MPSTLEVPKRKTHGSRPMASGHLSMVPAHVHRSIAREVPEAEAPSNPLRRFIFCLRGRGRLEIQQFMLTRRLGDQTPRSVTDALQNVHKKEEEEEE